MSGTWEVVGKTKQKHNGQPVKKLTKTEKKKFVENAPKVEDILPLAQIKSLYTALDNNKENKKPVGKENNSKENEAKKKQKKQPEKKKEVVKEKAPVPKSFESAASSVDSKYLLTVFEENQARFPEAPLVWLRTIAEYLNQKLEHSNPAAFKTPEHPLCVLPGSVREVLQRVVREAGEQTTQLFYELCLTYMANDMSKGSNLIFGYKVLLQFITFKNPGVTIANVPKVTALWNSYQNRQPIGLTLLWAFGLSGVRDFYIGLKAWQILMLPLLELKNYSSHVITSLKDILSSKARNKPMTVEQFFTVFDIIHNPTVTLPNNLRQELQRTSPLLRARLFQADGVKLSDDFFQPFLARLKPTITKELKDELLASLVTCLSSDQHAFSSWKQVYHKYLQESTMLLKYLDFSWKNNKTKISSKLLKEMLTSFQAINQELSNPMEEQYVQECQVSSERLLRKMTVTSSSRPSAFPWRFGSFLLLLAIAGLVTFDIKKHGSFKSSSTGLFLKDIGALKHGEEAWAYTKVYAHKSYRWAEVNVPHYYKIASEQAKPYMLQAWDLIWVVCHQINLWYGNIHAYVEEKTPIAVAWLNHYAPGLIEKVKEISVQTWQLAQYYGLELIRAAIHYLHLAMQWAKTNIFVGNLSPENLQKYSMEALNTTQLYAEWTYNWVCQKVETLAKIQ